MWNALITVGGWALFGVLVLFWAWWADREREQFSNGDFRHLE
jgi:hypothetical protein